MVSRGMRGRTCRPVGLHLNSPFHRSQDGILYEVIVRLTAYRVHFLESRTEILESEKSKSEQHAGQSCKDPKKGGRKVMLVLML
jgi:hypothetical protein